MCSVKKMFLKSLNKVADLMTASVRKNLQSLSDQQTLALCKISYKTYTTNGNYNHYVSLKNIFLVKK